MSQLASRGESGAERRQAKGYVTTVSWLRRGQFGGGCPETPNDDNHKISLLKGIWGCNSLFRGHKERKKSGSLGSLDTNFCPVGLFGPFWAPLLRWQLPTLPGCETAADCPSHRSISNSHRACRGSCPNMSARSDVSSQSLHALRCSSDQEGQNTRAMP